MSRMRAFRGSGCLTVAVALLSGPAARGAALSWANAAGGLASTAGNWSPAQVPTAVDDLTYSLAANYAVTFNSTTAGSHTQTFRNGTVTLTISSPHTVTNGITIGDTNGSTGTAIVTTGTVTSSANVTLGTVAGSTGILTVNDDDADVILSGATTDLTVGNNGNATLNITGGGLIVVPDQFIAGANLAATNVNVTVSGQLTAPPFTRSTLDVTGTSQSRIGAGGDVTMNVASGALADFDGSLVVANGSASVSSLTVGGGLIADATVDVAGDLLLGRNTSAGAAGGIATLSANGRGDVLVGGTLFVAGDPDGGTATLSLADLGSITTNSFSSGPGATLNLVGGALDIVGGTLSNTNTAPFTFGGVDHPVITMRAGATGTLSTVVAARALTVGGGLVGTAEFADFDIRSGAGLTVTAGDVIIGEAATDNGGMIVNGTGSSLTMSPGTLVVGLSGTGRFETELGGTASLARMFVAQNASATGSVLIENTGTTASLTDLYIGGSHTVSGGNGDFFVNANAVVTVTGGGTAVRIWPNGQLDAGFGGILNVPNGNIDLRGDLIMEDRGEIHAASLVATNGSRIRGHVSVPGTATVEAVTTLQAGALLELINGDLTIGKSASPDGFLAQDLSLINVGSHTLTLLDSNRALVDDVTIAGGQIIAPNGLEIVTPGTNGTLTGTGTITTSELFMESGGSVITATTANGITINGKFRNNSGLIDGTKYTFTNNPAITDSGWTGAGTIDAQVVFGAGTKVNALANMTMGNGLNFGVTFGSGTELHAGTRTVTLLDANGVSLPSVTDLSGGHVVCAQPLTVVSDRRLSGRGGSIDAPVVSVFGELSPGELTGVPAGETGELTINGALTLGVDSNTNIEIQGLLGPIEYDKVTVNGAANLNGNLNISFLNGFVPPFGSVWTVMEYDSKTGEFAHINVSPSAPSCVFVAISDRAVVVSRGLPGDLDDDGDVDINDLALLLSSFGCRGGVEFPCPIDLDFNGDTDITDLAILLSNFGQACN